MTDNIGAATRINACLCTPSPFPSSPHTRVRFHVSDSCVVVLLGVWGFFSCSLHRAVSFVSLCVINAVTERSRYATQLKHVDAVASAVARTRLDSDEPAAEPVSIAAFMATDLHVSNAAQTDTAAGMKRAPPVVLPLVGCLSRLMSHCV